jgi:hypothetical protein
MKNQGTKNWIQDYLEIVDKGGELVTFNLNPIQDKFLSKDTNNSREIILKARQQGFSSLILAMFAKDFVLKENSYNVVVADDTDNAQGLLKRVKDYLRTYFNKKGFALKDALKYNSKYEMYFEPMNTTYVIGTAQNVDFGRSKTITNLHLSESAYYPNLSDIIAGAGQAVVNNGRLILETTANGFNEFKTLWDQSVEGHGPFQTHFYPASNFYSPEFLQSKKQEFKALGKELLFHQEYPETPEEAFITSGQTYFDKKALKYYLNQVKDVKEI